MFDMKAARSIVYVFLIRTNLQLSWVAIVQTAVVQVAVVLIPCLSYAREGYEKTLRTTELTRKNSIRS